MSRVKTQNPVIHTPSFNTYEATTSIIASSLRELKLTLPMSVLDGKYYYTDGEGWAKILINLLVKSNLYKTDKFDCDNLALKAMTLCAERYDLNTMAFAIGNIPSGRHAFNLIYTGEDWLIFEPNEGFRYQGQAFPIGENGYKPEMVLV